jgi:hypothetical protein
MRLAFWLAVSALLVGAPAASAQTKPTQPTQPLGPVPSGGTPPVANTDGRSTPTRGILYIPQFAPPGTQVPGGPPASDTPTLLPQH